VWPHKVVVDLVHGDDWRVIYPYAPHDLLSFANAAVHPFQDVIKALLQSYISNVLAALMMIIKLSIKRLLVGWQTICDHQPRLLVADFLGLPEGLLSILNFPSLGDHADHMEPGLFIHDVPEPSPFAANLDLISSVCQMSPSSGSSVAT